MAIQRLPKPERFNARGANLKTLFPGDGASAGNPTIPGLARGLVDGTLIAYTNSQIEHMCDFIDEMRKNVKLKQFVKAAAASIRDGIRALLNALGVDPTGVSSWLVSTMKDAARELLRIQKEIIKPVLDFEKYVLAYITRIRAIITWLKSLPARFRALLAACYAKLMMLINSVFLDFFQELTAGTGIGDVMAAAKDLTAAAYSLRASVTVAVKGAEQIQTQLKGISTIPASLSDLSRANSTIDAYQATIPSADKVASSNAAEKPNKNGP